MKMHMASSSAGGAGEGRKTQESEIPELGCGQWLNFKWWLVYLLRIRRGFEWHGKGGKSLCRQSQLSMRFIKFIEL